MMASGLTHKRSWRCKKPPRVKMLERLIQKYKREYRVAEEIEAGGLISDVYKGVIEDLEKLLGQDDEIT